MPPKKGRKSSGRKPARKLKRWVDNAELIQEEDDSSLILLHLQYLCSQEGVKLPWDKVAEMMGEPVTTSSLLQHLAKVRERREEAGKPVPPPLPRAQKRKTAKDIISDDESEDEEEPPAKKFRGSKMKAAPQTRQKSRKHRANDDQEDKAVETKSTMTKKGNSADFKSNKAKKEKGTSSKSTTVVIKDEPEEDNKLQESKSSPESDMAGSCNQSDDDKRLSRSASPKRKRLVVHLKVPSLRTGLASEQGSVAPTQSTMPLQEPGAIEAPTQFVPHDTNPYVVGARPQFGMSAAPGMPDLVLWENMQTGFMPADMDINSIAPTDPAELEGMVKQWMLPDDFDFDAPFTTPNLSYPNPLPGQEQFDDGTIDPIVLIPGANMDSELDTFVNFDHCPQARGETNGGEEH